MLLQTENAKRTKTFPLVNIKYKIPNRKGEKKMSSPY